MPDDAGEVSRLERADTLGLAVLRTVIILNSGAVLALITFLGSGDAQLNLTIPIADVKESMAAFLLGITTVLLALIVSYTFTAANPDTGWAKWWNDKIIPVNAVLAVISTGSFVCGVCILLFGIEATP